MASSPHNTHHVSQSILIEHATVLTEHGPWERGWLLVEKGKITRLAQGDAPTLDDLGPIVKIDGQGFTVLPGYIDPHVHGAVGFDTMDATPEALTAISRFFASRGVTSFLPTTMTALSKPTTTALENIKACLGPVEGGATILGCHLEGPYINAYMKGAQEGSHVRRADPAEYLPWFELNVIKEVTVAPEFPENLDFIQACVERGIVVSIGHTKATYEDVRKAVELGARQSTHTFNAMTGLHHRYPGTAGGVLSSDEISCELIGDYVHVHPAVLKIAQRTKGTERIILITDAIRGAGLPDGLRELGGQPVNVSNGIARLTDGTLAGSVLTMDHAVKNMVKATGLPLADLWPISSANMARQLGLDTSKGKLLAGYDADIVLLDADYNVRITIVAGQIAYRADQIAAE